MKHVWATTVLLKRQDIPACDYDFYIINDEDAPKIVGWVRHLLLPGLECPFYGLKGYYHERDAKLGQLEGTAQGKAMESSAYIIVIITKGFTENRACVKLANMAFRMRSDNVAVVQNEAVQIPDFLAQCRRFDFSSYPDINGLAKFIMPNL